MSLSTRETVRAALEKSILLHEQKNYEIAEMILRQTLRVFMQDFYTDVDETAEKALAEGMEYLCKKDSKNALPHLEKAYSLQPDSRSAFINSIYCNFDLGNYEQVWTLYEDRLKHFNQMIAYKKMFDPVKRWNGVDSLSGKTVLVFCEQGLGDAINFSRYLKYLKQENCKIILNCAQVMEKLFKINSFRFVVDEIVTKESVTFDSIPEHDYHLPLMSLPYLLKIYEPKPETYIDIYESKLATNCDKYRVGIIWKGNPDSGNDKIRSINVNWFRQLQGKNIELHNLHYAELAPEGFVNHVGEIKNIYDVGCLINNMDLVVTVDTAVLHLAGAMGKKTWALIPFNPDWRWKLDGKKCVWYPTVTLYRQTHMGDWDDVFKQVSKDMAYMDAG